MSDSCPPTKRIRLASPSLEPASPQSAGKQEVESQPEEDNCSICLQPVVDRALIPKCSHEFCFECLTVWSEQSRRCPLCSQGVGEYVIHHIRSKYDYQKFFLPPLRTSPLPLQPLSVSHSVQPIANRRPTRREREWGRRVRQEREEADKLERSISKRRWIYRHQLYAKHVSSNPFTRYRPFPTPAQFSASADYMSRATTFIRRELQVWPNLDVEFLTTFILSIMKSIDIRAESTVKLLSEFLDMDEPYIEGSRHPNAEHFAHEMYCYLRSPYRDLYVYDTIVQYDTPPDLPSPPTEFQRTRRWRPRSASPSSLRSSISSLSPRPAFQIEESSHEHASSERPTASSSLKHPRLRSPSRSRSRSILHHKDRDGSQRDREIDNIHHCAGQNLPDNEHSGDESPGANKDITQVKGKGKARDKRVREENLRLENISTDTTLEISNQMHETPPSSKWDLTAENGIEPGPSKPRQRVKGRGPTLLESVHSHLSLPGNPTARQRSRLDHGTKEQRTPVLTPHGSLLARLSNPGRKNTQPMEAAPTDAQAHPPERTTTLSFSAPDIMARTRARLAKIKNESVAENPPLAPTPASLVPSMPSSTCDASSVRELRSKLLDKLEEERRQINDGIRAPSISTPEPEVSNSGDTHDGESLTVESNLRTQAQLRVRLAAVKRARSNHNMGRTVPNGEKRLDQS